MHISSRSFLTLPQAIVRRNWQSSRYKRYVSGKGRELLRQQPRFLAGAESAQADTPGVSSSPALRFSLMGGESGVYFYRQAPILGHHHRPYPPARMISAGHQQTTASASSPAHRLRIEYWQRASVSADDDEAINIYKQQANRQ